MKKLLAEEEEEERKRQFALQKAEIHQLESFVKTRSKELDTEIESLREKLKTKTTTMGSNATAANRSMTPTMRSTTRSLSPGSIENDSLGHLTHAAAHGSLQMQGQAIGRVELNPQMIMEESRSAAHKMNKQTREFQRELLRSEQLQEEILGDKQSLAVKAGDDRKQQLITFLAKLRLSKCFRF
jgi:hypothetical protein